MKKVTPTPAAVDCPVCGYPRPSAPCAVCQDEAARLGKRASVQIGPGNPIADVLRGLDDVRRAVFALLFEREFIGKLRLPVATNMAVMLALGAAGWFWLLPAFEAHFADRGEDGAHLWALAVWLGAGPSLLDLLAGWAMDPIRRATEQHMLGATPTHPERLGPSGAERLQLLGLAAFAVLLMLGAVLVPWVGVPLSVLLGAAVAAVVYMQPPIAVRCLPLGARLQTLRRQPWRALGAGLGLQLAAAVPFLNLLALLPVATITATSTYLHMHKGSAAPAREKRSAASTGRGT